MLKEDTDDSALDSNDSNTPEENVASLAGEKEVVTKKARPKKKRTEGDFLRAEVQIKKRDEIKKSC